MVVSSSGHKFGSINKEDFNSEKSYSKIRAYAQSKLANILFARELSKRLAGTNVTVNALHPGVVRTELGRFMNPHVKKALKFFMSPFQKTPFEGAQTQIMLAVDPDLETVTGKYFSDCEEVQPSKSGTNDEMASWLWEKSAKLTNLEEDIEVKIKSSKTKVI